MTDVHLNLSPAYQWEECTAENAPASRAISFTNSISAGVSLAKTFTPTTT